MTISNCKFCLETKPLIRSHIIPVGLYPKNENGDRRHWLLDGDGQHTKSSIPNGDYDGKLVCADCEKRFGPGDAYAKRFFVDRSVPSDLLSDESGAKMHVYPAFDYDTLKLFFVSLLWRAHASDRQAYRNVDIGTKFADAAKAMICSGRGGSPDDFAVFLWHFSQGPYNGMATSPIALHVEGVLVYQTILFGHSVFVKVDEQPLPPLLRGIQLTKDRPLVVIEYAMEETRFPQIAGKAVAQAEATAGRLRPKKQG